MEKISNSIASNKIFPKMLKDTKTANEIAIENNWIKENDTDIIHNYIYNKQFLNIQKRKMNIKMEKKAC